MFSIKIVLCCQHVGWLCHLLVYVASGFGGHACSKCVFNLEIVLCCQHVGWLCHLLVYQTVLDQATKILAGMLVCMLGSSKHENTSLVYAFVCLLQLQSAACYGLAYIPIREQHACWLGQRWLLQMLCKCSQCQPFNTLRRCS